MSIGLVQRWDVSPKTLTGSPLVSTFAFERHPSEYPFQIRVVEIDGNPWFVAKDVCDVLGVDQTASAIRRLDPCEVSKIDRIIIGMRPGKAASVVSESGLYKLVMRSDKPVAKPFQDWVTRTVLPAIRKDGMYVLGEEKVATGAASRFGLSITGLTGTTITGILTDGLDQPLTMSTLEIKDLLECRHDNVKRTVERLAGRGVIQLPPMEEVINHLGQRVEVYLLDKRSSYIVVAQLSPEFTARVVDRWQELEAKAAAPVVPQSLPEALRLAADLAEKNAALAVENQKLAPLAKVGDVAVSHKRGVVEIGRKLPSDLKRPIPRIAARS